MPLLRREHALARERHASSMGRLAGLAHHRHRATLREVLRLLCRAHQEGDEAKHAECALHPPSAARRPERPRAEPLQLLFWDEGLGFATPLRRRLPQRAHLRAHAQARHRRGRPRLPLRERGQRLRSTDVLPAGTVIFKESF